MKKFLKTIAIGLTSLMVMAVPAFAHVTVTPNRAGIASYQTFTMTVPNEKDSPTVGIRLLLPDGVESVMPNVKPGWTIDLKKNEIDWTGGSIPAGERDEFAFNVQVPAKPTTLGWKVYQTYENGTVVSWDEDPKSMSKMTDEEQDKMVDEQNKGPYSQTSIVNDLRPATTARQMTTAQIAQKTDLAVALSVVALALSCIAFATSRKRN